MIGGDHVIAAVSSNPLIEPPLDPAHGRPKSLLQYNASLSRLLKMPVDVIYSGHGEEVRNVDELITAAHAHTAEHGSMPPCHRRLTM